MSFIGLHRGLQPLGRLRRLHENVAQGQFLQALGIAERAVRLARGSSPSGAAAVTAGLHRLIAPSAMGRLFQALAITHPALSTPPGFA